MLVLQSFWLIRKVICSKHVYLLGNHWQFELGRAKIVYHSASEYQVQNRKVLASFPDKIPEFVFLLLTVVQCFQLGQEPSVRVL